MNPLHSPRNKHSKTKFGKKKFKKKFGESETFPGSKFSPATGVILHSCIGEISEISFLQL